MKRTTKPKNPAPAVTAADAAAKPRPGDATATRRRYVEPVRVLPGFWPTGPDV